MNGHICGHCASRVDAWGLCDCNRPACNTCRHDEAHLQEEPCYSCGGHGNWTPAAFEPLQSTKDTNPKDAVGSTKVPLDIVPPSLMAYASVALHNGAGKYGTANYRAIGIRASIYVGALLRHVHAWQQGEESDEEGIPNLAAAAACLAILIDGVESGFITDDRPPSENFRATLDKLTEIVRANTERNTGKNPRHYTIADSRDTE